MRHADALTLKQLRALAAVLREGGVGAAAAALHVTPPAVSTQLRNLDANLGGPTLTRDDHGAYAPTEAGAILLDAARRVEAALARAGQKIDALERGFAGQVTLGVVSTGKYFAPRLVAQARAALPGVEIRLRIRNRRETIAALAEGAFDLAIMGRPPREPAVEAVRLGEHPHLLIAPPDHPLAHRKRLTPEQLADETFLMREAGSGTRILAERWLERLDAPPRTDEFDSNETIKQAVMAGLGVALISGHTCATELAQGRLIALDAIGTPVRRSWFAVLPRDVAPSAATRNLADFLTATASAFPPLNPA